MANSRGPYLGRVGRRTLRTADPPPGGWVRDDRHGESAKLRKEEERRAVRQLRERMVFERFALMIGIGLVLAFVVLIVVVVALH